MNHTEDGGPAFPTEVGSGGQMLQTGNQQWSHPGMTLRDHFAGLAMNGYLASLGHDIEPVEYAAQIAKDSYTLADAMLKARAE